MDDSAAANSKDGTRSMPKCYFCFSTDTMPPFRRSARVFLLSRVLPVRWRYCRKCARHFVTSGRPRSH